MIESGSARRVAVVRINATNSWRAESRPARSAGDEEHHPEDGAQV